MKTGIITAILIASIALIFCALPATAEDQQPAQTTEVTNTNSTTQDATKAAESDKEKARKEEERKLEEKKRREVEREERRRDRTEHHDHDDYDVYDSHTESSSSGSSNIFSGFGGGPIRTDSVALVYAPGGFDEAGAFGVQWISNRRWGIGLWTTGNLGGDDDAIHAAIPHNDYYVETDKTGYGIQGLYCLGNSNAALLLGVGIATSKTKYTDVSNATGWEWDGGEDTNTQLAGLIGCRFHLSGRIGLQLGYDSSQHSYFGLTGSF
ncbi:MAG: hypothetical protein ABFD54_09665 [Armatimonadota bacterium]